MSHTNITVSLNNGSNYGCNALASAKKFNHKTNDFQPALAFVCCEIAQTELLSDIKSISISAGDWCPTCE